MATQKVFENLPREGFSPGSSVEPLLPQTPDAPIELPIDYDGSSGDHSTGSGPEVSR